jgi:hypothetical protein
MGDATKLRRGAMPFSIDGPVAKRAATLSGRRAASSNQNRSSGQSSTRSLRAHWT